MSEIQTPTYDFKHHDKDAKFGVIKLENGNFSMIQDNKRA